MKKSLHLFSILMLINLIFISCRKDEDQVAMPMNPNENELITTMKLVFKESGTPSNIIEAMFKDLDGEGGKPPVIDTIKLNSDKSYNVDIWLIDENKTTPDTITYEIKKEGYAHQFFFSASQSIDVLFKYSDMDKNGVPIGLSSIWTLGEATTSIYGKIRILLKHQGEDKPDSGNGDINIGSTDIDVSFPILIQ